jgi:hypothetical protein
MPRVDGPSSFKESDAPDVVGGFGHNACASCASLNSIFCFSTPEWYQSACLGCGCDSSKFRADDANWSKGAPLRTQFEERLREPGLKLAMQQAPTQYTCCFGGCPVVDASLPDHINSSEWCARVNQELLFPAGYECRMEYWVIWPEKAGGSEDQHLQLQIRKRQQGAAGEQPVQAQPQAQGSRSAVLPGL